MGLADRIKTAYQVLISKDELPFASRGGAYVRPKNTLQGGVNNGFLIGSKRDWEVEAGDLWRSSVVSIALNFISNKITSAPLMEAKVNAKGQLVYKDRPSRGGLLDALKYSGEGMPYDVTLNGIITSYFVDGNVYLFLRKNGNSIVGMQWVPFFMMEPRWEPGDNTKYITHYDYFYDGKTLPISAENILHIRQGVDPRNYRKGFAPLKGQLRQVFGDNEYGTYFASLMKDGAYFPLLASLADGGQMSDDQAKMLADTMKQVTRGDGRGSIAVAPANMKVERLNSTPEEMACDKLVQQPMERILGSFPIDPLCVSLPSPNRGSYDNREQAERAAWHNCVIPFFRAFQSGFELLCRDNYLDGTILAFNTNSVPELQEDKVKLYPVMVQACGGPFLTPNEARSEMGHDELPDVELDEIRQSQPQQNHTDAENEADAQGDKQNDTDN